MAEIDAINSLAHRVPVQPHSRTAPDGTLRKPPQQPEENAVSAQAEEQICCNRWSTVIY
ncbi:hypothetical protein [Streptomyces sp. cg35]|uniref:hypothetical protein n=1 Tax=Streptomyces sp. cg35 TaxID=3421650 RepID=UPI003D1856FE